MPSTQHEAIVQVVHLKPSVVTELVRDVLGIKVPGSRQARLDSNDLSDVKRAERRADAVVVLTGPADAPVLGVIVEVQLNRDQRKWWTWPMYLMKLRTRLKIPVMLLVLCTDPRIAAWCVEPIELGPGWSLGPFVAGPNQIPTVAHARRGRMSVELAVLSLLAHADDPGVTEMFPALAAMLDLTDPDNATQYAELVAATLHGSALKLWEDLMAIETFEFQSRYARRLRAEGRAQGRAEGRAEGEARLLLKMLEARGIDVPNHIRTRISECTDLDQLDRWADRVLSATSVHDLFD
jgi:hypothetical protein